LLPLLSLLLSHYFSNLSYFLPFSYRDTHPIDSRIAPLSLLTSPSIIVTDSQLFEDSEWWKRRRLGSSDLAIEVFTVL
jgi:hypothetical protein